jgi:hypothetical protein
MWVAWGNENRSAHRCRSGGILFGHFEMQVECFGDDDETFLETDTVPKTFVNDGRMRLPLPNGDTQPLGDRIIILPEDVSRTLSRDPHSGFVAYVPIGSIARGETLVTTGGSSKTIPCAGTGEVPSIWGFSPIYIFRQLYGIQAGTRTGSRTQLMKAVVAHLNEDDMVAIAAYLASRTP